MQRYSNFGFFAPKERESRLQKKTREISRLNGLIQGINQTILENNTFEMIRFGLPAARLAQINSVLLSIPSFVPGLVNLISQYTHHDRPPESFYNAALREESRRLTMQLEELDEDHINTRKFISM